MISIHAAGLLKKRSTEVTVVKCEPVYRSRISLRELRHRAEQLIDLLKECVVCPRECRARRTEGRHGVCRSTDEIIIASSGPHYGEEPPLVGFRGSGTVFFSSCTLKCLYCQNYDISHERYGKKISTRQLAEIMLSLEQSGCHNINLVTPTHVTSQIVGALVIAVEKGLSVPIVYNCGGYESVRTLRLLDDIIDIYMPDIKYSNDEYSRKYSGVKNYWEIVRLAITEMQRQVGDLSFDDYGIATRGLLIRHLVLPNQIAGSKAVLEFIARDVSHDAYVNIMDQYRPMYRAHRYPELSRPTTSKEYREVVEYACRVGLHRGFGEKFLMKV